MEVHLWLFLSEDPRDGRDGRLCEDNGVARPYGKREHHLEEGQTGHHHHDRSGRLEDRLGQPPQPLTKPDDGRPQPAEVDRDLCLVPPQPDRCDEAAEANASPDDGRTLDGPEPAVGLADLLSRSKVRPQDDDSEADHGQNGDSPSDGAIVLVEADDGKSEH